MPGAVIIKAPTVVKTATLWCQVSCQVTIFRDSRYHHHHHYYSYYYYIIQERNAEFCRCFNRILELVSAMEHDHLGTSDQDPIGDPNCTFSSYTDFVQLLASQQPQYKWLLDFLIHATDGLGQNTKLFVADSENGCLVQKSIQPELLGQCPSSVKTRLVLIHYEEVWSIDRGLVDRVSLALNVPPYFLWQHFEHSSHNCERSAPNYRPIDLGLRRHIISPSQMFSLEIGDNGLLHMSSLLLMPSAACPVSIGQSVIISSLYSQVLW